MKNVTGIDWSSDSPDIIGEVYVRGKKVQPEQFVDAVVSLVNERTKKEQAET